MGGVAAAILVGLLVVPDAFARAGGGSSSFGRGGGGGGVGRGFGRGHFFFIPVGGGGGVLLFILVVVVLLWVLPRVLRWWQGQQSAGVASRRRVAARERRVELAAAEATEDDAAFAPERVRSQAASLFVNIQSAWDAGDRVRLRGLVAPDLLAEWERRLDDFDRKGWRNRVRPIGEPSIEYVGLTNRGEDRDDRVVVRIEARPAITSRTPTGSASAALTPPATRYGCARLWTLVKRDGHWILQSIEQGAEGAHRLREGLVATPWGDEQALRDEAVVEGAVQDAVPDGKLRLAEVADLDFEGDGRAAALDLSLADGRFAPNVLEVAARRAVAAWATPSTATTLPCSRSQIATSRASCCIPATPASAHAWSCAASTCVTISIVSLDAGSSPPR